MREAVVVASSRTPLAKSHRGSFNITRPDDLAAHCIQRRARQGAPARPRRKSRTSSSAAASRTAPQGHNIARVAAMRAGLPVTRGRVDGQPLLLLGPAGHRAWPPTRSSTKARTRRSAAASSRITMMERDSEPEPVGEGAHARHLHGHGRHGRGRRQALQDQPPGAGRVLAVEPAAHGAGAAGGLLQGRAGADAGHARRARQEDRREDRRGGRTTSTRTSATAPTRRSKGCWRCRRTSTRRAARAPSPPATPRSSPTAPRPRS